MMLHVDFTELLLQVGEGRGAVGPGKGEEEWCRC